jgi:Pyridine nucleotide-disulphide oxidoreductase, dimerisation domain
MTEAKVRKSGKPALIATMAMENVSRALEKGEAKHFMKILVDSESKRMLGASILGTGGDEVIHRVFWVVDRCQCGGGGGEAGYFTRRIQRFNCNCRSPRHRPDPREIRCMTNCDADITFKPSD